MNNLFAILAIVSAVNVILALIPTPRVDIHAAGGWANATVAWYLVLGIYQ